MAFPALRASGLITPTVPVVAGAATFAGAHSGRYVVASMATAFGYVLGFSGEHSGDWSVASATGARAALEHPVGTLSCTATVTNTADFAGEHSGYTVASTVSVPRFCTAELAHGGRYTVSSRTGARTSGTLPTGTVASTATVGSVGRFAATGRVGTVTSRATVQNFARAELVGPAVRALNGFRFAGRAPKGRLASTASQTVALTYEGYSITLIPGELGTETRTTRLTVCPFDHVVRLGAKYFGVGPDGVYELTGDDYAGTPIVAVVETAPDGEAQNLKRPRAMFIGGRLNGDFNAGVKVGESGEYSFGETSWAGTRNQRVKFGRGVSSRYLAYTFTNTAGDDFQIDDITPEYDIVRRTLGGVE